MAWAKSALSSAIVERWTYIEGLLFIVVVAFLPGGLASLAGIAKLRRWWRIDRSSR